MKRIPLEEVTAAELSALYDQLDRAESDTRSITHAARRIRRALEALPALCRYHGDRLDPDSHGWRRTACCDTGTPALLRREALAALTGLTTRCPDLSSDSPDTRGGIVRTPVRVGEETDCGTLPTRPDATRTRPDIGVRDGVRVKYRADVPRYLVGAALAEALHTIDRAIRTGPPPPPPDADTIRGVRTAPARSVRRGQARAAISHAFDIPADHQ